MQPGATGKPNHNMCKIDPSSHSLGDFLIAKKGLIQLAKGCGGEKKQPCATLSLDGYS